MAPAADIQTVVLLDSDTDSEEVANRNIDALPPAILAGLDALTQQEAWTSSREARSAR